MYSLYKINKAITLIIFLIPFVQGCFFDRDTQVTDEKLYATVDGVELTEMEFRTRVPAEFYDTLTPEMTKEVVDEWIANEVLYSEALRRGINKEPFIALMLKNSARDFLNSELLELELATIETPTDDILKLYYENNQDYFVLISNEYEVRYVILSTLAEADDFWRKVKNGVPFSDLAVEMSIDPSNESGGMLGIINKSMTEEATWEEIEKTFNDPTLGLGKISKPFEVMDGWGILIIDNVYKEGTVRPFDLVRAQVENYYMIEKRKELKEQLMNKLKAKASIEYNF